ncbi:DinB family protein [uncultured Muriicola sp.]|uniref:DinB family protein n=1 Tax=uncultured Muriicola sp. TaxID=1583102 RepID=UPI00260DAA82|nr:DinB family protein [uncultured Muriicola sp.]
MNDIHNSQPAIIADHIKQVYFGGNWTAVNLKDTLNGISWEMASRKVESFHSIAELVYHMNYFVTVLLKVLHGKPLQGNDAVSFDCPPINSQADWESLQKRVFAEVEEFADLVAALPEYRLWELVSDKKYGTYYRNIHGIVEHCHYHLGQIVLIKKYFLQDQ